MNSRKTFLFIACGLIIIVGSGCAGVTGVSQFKSHETKATYQGHGNQEVDISALAKVDLGMADWAEINSELLESKIFIGFRGGEQSEYEFSSVTLKPGVYWFTVGRDFGISVLVDWDMHEEVAIPTKSLYLEAGHVYRIQTDRTTYPRITFSAYVYDMTIGEYVNFLCLSENREAPSRIRILAETGDPQAQYQLGKWFQDGLCIDQDFTTALEWLQKSATQGIDLAQYEIAGMYRNGIGIERNLELAKFWYQKSADQGNDSAEIYLEEVIKEMECEKNPLCTGV